MQYLWIAGKWEVDVPTVSARSLAGYGASRIRTHGSGRIPKEESLILDVAAGRPRGYGATM